MSLVSARTRRRGVRSRYASHISTGAGVVRALYRGARIASRFYRPSDQHNRLARQHETIVSQPQPKRMRRRINYKVTSRTGWSGRAIGGGSYAGRFKKPKKHDNSFKRGVTQRHESNGEVSGAGAADAVWIIGSPIAPATFMPALLLAVLRKLCQKGGQDFTDGNEYTDGVLAGLTGNVLELRYDYTVGSEPDLVERVIQGLPVQTWIGLAQAWYADLAGAVTGGRQDFFLNNVTLMHKARDATNEPTGSMAKLNMQDFKLVYSMSSVLKLQNRTGANSGTDLDATDVEANPIVGRRYEIKGRGPLLRLSNDDIVTPQFAVDLTTGISAPPAVDASYSSLISNLMVRPPNKMAFRNCNQTCVVRLQPGHIKTGKVVYSGTMDFNKYFNKLCAETVFGYGVNPQTSLWGRSQAYCFEKALRTGSGTAVVNVGYEHNQYHSFLLIRKKKIGFTMLQA